MPNRLAAETSPYLLQHADNPVDWYPWGAEAFQQAQAENKPILLSVGYSACHWCHVMAHESFEDEKIAAIMNACFVNIKVDREERPDVDAIYMAAVQAMTRHGGWPMTVFLTPEGKPFYGGTYFPPNERPGMPSFPRVLASIAEHYATNPTEITTTSDRLTAHLAEFGLQEASPGALSVKTLDDAVVALKSAFDPENGGFGGAPKFPPSHSLEFLLRAHLRTQDPHALAMVEHTLEKMARGGLYDQLGGGFHRYATDEIWLVPHFEKMLYDNAQLARVYLLAYQATRKVLYEVVAIETLDYVVREMTDEQGGFYTAQDADSEGVEGKFFVWSYNEVVSLLGPEDGKLFAAAFDVTPQGNFEGESVLNLPRPLGEIAKREGVGVDRLGEAISRGRVVLFEAREARVKPGRDEKVLTAWNGMMLRAFAQAATTLDRPDYMEVAEKNANFVLTQLRAKDGKLLRTWSAGQAKLNAYLEDYAQYIDGLLALYEASFTPRWLKEALALTEVMLAEFVDAESGLLYDTGKSHERLITRPRDLFDNATPSGNAVAADVLLRLAHLTGEQRFSAHAQAILAAAGQMMQKYPSGAGRMLCALDFHLAPVREIALVGPAESEAMRAFKRGVHHHYRPHLVVAGGSDQSVSELAGRVALLRDRPARDGRATAYVCTGFVCQAPTHDPAEMLRQLGPE